MTETPESDCNIIAITRIEMENVMRAITKTTLLVMFLASCAAAEIVEEEESVEPDGLVVECGDGPGLEPCRDTDGETWKHADDPNYIKTDSNEQLEESAAKVRAESPKELEKTIQQIEDDEKG